MYEMALYETLVLIMHYTLTKQTFRGFFVCNGNSEHDGTYI